jgi:AcrR family transcriptional regulator
MNTKPYETELKRREALRLSNEESNRLTRECIRTALLKLMAEMSFEKITTTEIIRRSEFPAPAFYRNYNSKEDVLHEIFRSEIMKVKHALGEYKIAEDAYGFCLWAFREVRENADFYRTLMNARQQLNMSPEMHPHPHDKEQDTSRAFYIRRALQFAIPHIVFTWFDHDMKESPEEMAALCADLIRAMKGV